MIEAAARTTHRTSPAKAAEEYLGPAEVVKVEPHRVTVTLGEGSTVVAGLAFSMPYSPVAGDTLLVIGRGSAHYAIGVIRGTGRTDLTFQGDVEVRAVNGRLSLGGDRGVDVRGPELDIYTGALRVVARDVLQRFESVVQRVSAVLRVHAGEAQTIVDGSSTTQAKSASILTEETVNINGREVHLG